jgi:AcrR family transcriptional regulator
VEQDKRQHILGVALRHFADRGYAGTSVQEIVDEANVAKPMLYYYFQNKAGLYQALIDSAHDERFRVLTEAAASGDKLSKKLTAVLSAFFRFIKNKRDLVRLAFASTFAAPGELPPELCYKEKCTRGFEFFHDLIKAGQANGEIDAELDSRQATIVWYGIMNMFMMGQLFRPEVSYDEETARAMVDLFFRGAGAKGRKKGPVRSKSGTHR